MPNRKDATTLIVVALLALVVGGVGLWLGFRPVQPHGGGKPVPKAPDQGPIIYEMTSIFSAPNRIQLRWKDVPGASAYLVTLMTASDDSLFASDSLKTSMWTIPDPLRAKMPGQSVYHWKLTVFFADRPAVHSEAAAFATQ